MGAFARALDQAMKDYGIRTGGKMTQNRLAERARLDQSHVSKMVRGVVLPQYETIQALVTALGLPRSTVHDWLELRDQDKDQRRAKRRGTPTASGTLGDKLRVEALRTVIESIINAEPWRETDLARDLREVIEQHTAAET